MQSKFHCPPWRSKSLQILIGFWLLVTVSNKHSQLLSADFLTFSINIFTFLARLSVFRIRFAHKKFKTMIRKLKWYLQLLMKSYHVWRKHTFKLPSYELSNLISKFIKCSVIWKALHCSCLICSKEKHSSVVIHWNTAISYYTSICKMAIYFHLQNSDLKLQN